MKVRNAVHNALRSITVKITVRVAMLVVFLAMAVAGCEKGNGPTETPTSAVTLPPPDVRVTSMPDAELAVQSFLDSWKAEDFQGMYAMLTPASQEKISLEDFTFQYEDVANQTLMSGLDYELLSVTTNPDAAEALYTVKLQSVVFEELVRQTKMSLELVNGKWLVNWDATAILPELAGGNYLRLDREGIARATIYDRKGQILAGQSEAAAFGVWPGFVDLTDDDTLKGLITLLATLSGYRTETIIGMIEEV